MSFEKDNEERRRRALISENIIKQYAVKNLDEVYHVGTSDIIDDYSGKPIYDVAPVSHHDEVYDVEPEYEDNQEEGFDTSGMSEEALNTANEIYQRLMAEAAADEMAKQAEIEAVMRQQEKASSISVYTSGTPSANYGQVPMSQTDSAAFDSIMNNNKSYTKSIEDLIAENQ